MNALTISFLFISVVNPWTRKGTHPTPRPTRFSGIEKKKAVKNILKIMDNEDDHNFVLFD